MKRQGRAEMAAALAPVAPPCFSSRDQWVEYASSCAIEQRRDHKPGPLLLEAGKPARFNPNFDICGDCDDSYAYSMALRGKCRPRYLVDLLTPAPAPCKETA